jgi:cysteine synthase
VIDDAESLGYLRPHTGSRIFEGTVGSTGISLATIARARLVIHFGMVHRLIFREEVTTLVRHTG